MDTNYCRLPDWNVLRRCSTLTKGYVGAVNWHRLENDASTQFQDWNSMGLDRGHFYGLDGQLSLEAATVGLRTFS